MWVFFTHTISHAYKTAAYQSQVFYIRPQYLCDAPCLRDAATRRMRRVSVKDL